MEKVINITKNNIEEIAKGVVLLDFWAPWCGPCRMISPIIEELARDFQNEDVKICKVNTDEMLDLAADYRVRSIPTIIIFINGKEVETLIGAQSKNNMTKAINSAIAKSKENN